MTAADEERTGRAPVARRTVVTTLLVLAIASFAAAAPTWVTAHGASASGAVVASVPGTHAAPGVGAAALIVAAAALALGLSGRVAQRVVGAVVVVAGVLCGVSVLSVLLNPEDPGADAVAQRTGVARTTSVALSPAPVVCLVLAVVVVLAGVWVLVRRITPRGTSRYEVGTKRPEGVAPGGTPGTGSSPQDPEPASPSELWDALSHGDDPT